MKTVQHSTLPVGGKSPDVVKRRLFNEDNSSDGGGFRSSGFRKLRSESWGSVQRWEKENELIFAMIEDECEWLSTLFPDEVIAPEYFFVALQDGVLLCKLIQLIQNHAASLRREHAEVVPDFIVKYHPRTSKKGRAAQFKARENVTTFLNWCRAHKIPEVILFESNDVVETDEYREGAREIVICLMEVARKAWKYGVTPPKLVLLEKEIEDEEIADGNHSPSSVDSGVDFDGNEQEEESQHSKDNSKNNNNGSSGKTKQRNVTPKSELDRKVLSLIEEYSIGKITRLKEGKYIILGRVMFIRMLNDHVLVRIGGGWDTLEHYLMTHAKPSAVENAIKQKKVSSLKGNSDHEETDGRSSRNGDIHIQKAPMQNGTPRVLTPVTGPIALHRQKYRTPAMEDKLQDALEISDAIRKIESSVTQSIQSRPRAGSHDDRTMKESISQMNRKTSDSLIELRKINPRHHASQIEAIETLPKSNMSAVTSQPHSATTGNISQPPSDLQISQKIKNGVDQTDNASSRQQRSHSPCGKKLKTNLKEKTPQIGITTSVHREANLLTKPNRNKTKQIGGKIFDTKTEKPKKEVLFRSISDNDRHRSSKGLSKSILRRSSSDPTKKLILSRKKNSPITDSSAASNPNKLFKTKTLAKQKKHLMKSTPSLLAPTDRHDKGSMPLKDGGSRLKSRNPISSPPVSAPRCFKPAQAMNKRLSKSSGNLLIESPRQHSANGSKENSADVWNRLYKTKSSSNLLNQNQVTPKRGGQSWKQNSGDGKSPVVESALSRRMAYANSMAALKASSKPKPKKKALSYTVV